MIEKGYLIDQRYQIIDTLGEGGMSNVYLALDIISKNQVAVKVLRLDLQTDPQTLHRFEREVLATSELSHTNIVSVLDVGTDHGLPYMVEEYVDGPNLKDYLQENNPLALDEVIRIMDQILSAMILAHEHGIIHRDLKPHNVLMDQQRNVKIADFGIAVALNQSSITQTNSALGSVHYMSPEQTRGSIITKQSDIYSLGIMLYELLTGSVPFTGESAVSVALKQVQEEIPSVRQKRKDVPQALENVILKACAKDLRDRYQTVAEMKAELDKSLDKALANVPVFMPVHHVREDHTIVIPDLAGKVEHAQSEQQSAQKDSTPGKFKALLKKREWISGIAVVAVLMIISLFALALYSRNHVRVPDMSNMTESQARVALQAVGLKEGKVEQAFSSEVKKGRIVKGLPTFGSLVAKGKSVALIVSKGARKVTVPDVTDLSYAKAKRLLVKLGFTVERVNRYSDDTAKGYVFDQTPRAGRKVVAANEVITLFVSKGQSQSDTFRMRDLTGYSLKSVQDYAKEMNVDLEVTEVPSDDVVRGQVVSQDPAPGSELRPGDTIKVNISSGKQKEEQSEDQNTHTFAVSFVDNGDEQGNHVQIYIQDDTHELSDLYRDLYITSDTSFSIPFTLKDGPGQIRIVRDGTTIVDESVN